MCDTKLRLIHIVRMFLLFYFKFIYTSFIFITTIKNMFYFKGSKTKIY